MMWERWWLLVALFVGCHAVDRSNFKTCDQSTFCKRNRALEPGESQYHVLPDTVVLSDSSVTMDVINKQNDVLFTAEIHALEDNTARIRINEKSPLHPRYGVQGVLIGEPKADNWKVQRSSDGFQAVFGNSTAVITFSPFRVDFLVNNEVAVSVNNRGLLNIEHYRNKKVKEEQKPEEEEADQEGKEEEDTGNQEEDPNKEEGDIEDFEDDEEDEMDSPPTDDGDDEAGMWEETFKTHHDSKPYGPSSVGLDVSFPGSEHVYGIPEHADSLALKVTKGSTDPYRLYNLDVFEYELNNPMALYGSIPYMVSHSAAKTVGVFWLNSAETWIDITSATAGQTMLTKLMSFFKSAEDTPQVDTHWFSESGIIDMFVMLGPSPRSVFRQYSRLAGSTMLPPLFSIAYHQSRWNYNDQEDVNNVNAGFDQYDFPMDVIWLDIEHTDGKKYFTWDSGKFPASIDMINGVAAKGRKMITIIDPHIKRESNYRIHQEAEAQELYVKKADKTSIYEGWCWPGSSSWIDFTNPDIRKWWAEQFALDKYQGSTLDLFTWNDMNEPSVFNGPEISMHKDATHYGGWEHRDVHNIYGMFQPQATCEGQVMRSGGKERPFVLSRAFFAGSQRYGAIWTGDNTATWDHLKISIPMILSINVAGLPFAGADVGGFFQNPEVDLLVRWYQAGAFYPFFRAHAHVDTKRREPWLYDDDKLAIMRDAVRMRYQLLPLWYTVFWESSVTGAPVVRPLWVEYPKDQNTYPMEDQFLLGNSLLVKPVTEQHTSSVNVYMPGTNAVWYDVQTYEAYPGYRWASIATPLSKIPVFQRGGSIVPKKMRVRRASSLMVNDPYTLVVALDNKGKAKGQLYSDDGHSLDYKQGQYLVRDFQFANKKLTSSSGDPNGIYKTKEWLERVIVIGMNVSPASITISSDEGEKNLRFKYDAPKKVVEVKKPGLNISKDFVITFS
ncbi:neutral alpha-glucosidase AB-like [Dysidea avara]|uniref:neutral alpha-glucosidase AB-like n=1 Tax=Dysidea avara TaxID=196820 RepID=UPI003326D19B